MGRGGYSIIQIQEKNMDMTKNRENPDEIKKEAVSEIAVQDDPTIPEEEKAQARAKAEAQETQKESTQKKEEKPKNHRSTGQCI